MNIFITGATGTLGREVISQLLEKTNHVLFGFSRDEQKQRTMPKTPRLTMILGDVRDRFRLTESTRNMDLIMHFAALKCVDTLEENPEESIATNIYGTENVLYAQRMNKINRVSFTSTDKAVYPINVYGMSKGASERLVLRNKNNVVARYGNVLNSRGSVIPEFIKSINETHIVGITDPEMTRFWITIQDAAKFVIESSFGRDGGLKIPSMKSSKVTDVAKTIADILDKPIAYNTIGIRSGEKLHESLKALHEGEHITSESNIFSLEELRALLKPIVEQHGSNN